MSSDYNFQTNGVYSFSVYPKALLGNDFQNVTILGTINYILANRVISCQEKHVQVYPYIPVANGTPNDYRQYNYIDVRLASGEETVLGIPWIDASTIVLQQAQTINVAIGNVTAADVDKVRNCLVANGYNNVDITISTVSQ